MKLCLVCTGSRKMRHTRRKFIAEGFNEIVLRYGYINLVIEGGAPGADTLCREEAIKRYIPDLTVPAKWNLHNNQAGPIRNQEMIVLARLFERDYIVTGLAFPAIDSKGTFDMIGLMKQEGWPVLTKNL